MAELFETVSHVQRSAELSECGRYRWWLRRSWQLWDDQGMHVRGKGVCCFTMLNPSTADALQDDPTIRRCIGFARAWGYDTLSVRNLIPFRTPDPSELRAHGFLTLCGGDRGLAELLAGFTADLLVAAWGAGVPYRRDATFIELWQRNFPDKPIYCLGTTKHGHPRHPLYVKGDTQPVKFAPTE